MGRRYYHIVTVFDHACCQAQYETLGIFVEVAENLFATKLSHKPDCVYFDTCHEKFHVYAGTHVVRSDLFWEKYDLWSHGMGF